MHCFNSVRVAVVVFCVYVCPLLASVARTGKGRHIEGISIMLSLCNGEVIYVYRSHTIRGARESAISDAKGVILNIQYCTHQKRSTMPP